MECVEMEDNAETIRENENEEGQTHKEERICQKGCILQLVFRNANPEREYMLQKLQFLPQVVCDKYWDQNIFLKCS